MQSCTRLSSQISALSPLGMETKLKVSSPNSCQSQAAWVERRREREERDDGAVTNLVPRLSVGGHKSLGMRLCYDFLCTRSSSCPPFHLLPLPSYMIPGSRDLLGGCHRVSGELQRSGLTCLLFVVCLFVCLLLLCVHCIPCA